MREFGRRTAIGVIGGMVAAPFLAACENPFQRPSTSKLPEIFLQKESEGLFRTGEVVISGDSRFVITNGFRYPVDSLYIQNSKHDQYGGKIKVVSSFPADQFPIGKEVAERNHIDHYTGGIKIIKKNGGEITLWSGGFLTDSLDLYDILKPEEDMFVGARKTLLGKNGFGTGDHYDHTYGIQAIDEMKNIQKHSVGQYRDKDTAKHPAATFRQADEWVRYILSKNPRVRLNLVGHSLGGLVMLYVAWRYPELVNNLILIASPVVGLDGDGAENMAKIAVAKGAIMAKLKQPEEVIDYLVSLRKNTAYRNEVNKLSKDLVARGAQVTVIASTDDGIVDVDATKLDGAERHISAMGTSPSKDIPGLPSISGHGIPVSHPKTVELISKKIGRNHVLAA